MISKKIGYEKSRDCRCECGSLIARLTPKGVELKCRRCKRIKIVPYDNTVRSSGLRITSY